MNQEFEEKLEALKDGMTEHLFTVPSGDEEELALPANESMKEFMSDTGESQEESSEEPREQSAPPRRKAPPKKDRSKERVAQKLYENQVLTAQKKELEVRNRALEEERYRLQEQIEKQEQYSNLAYVNNIGIKEDNIIRELEVAQEEADYKRAAMLQKELADLSAARHTHDLYNTVIKPQNNYVNQNLYAPQYDSHEQIYNNLQQQPYMDAAYDERSDNYEDFIENHSFANPNSQNFSRKLTSELAEISEQFDRMLEFEGKGSEIGSAEYYDTLSNVMNQKYSLSENQVPSSRNQQIEDSYDDADHEASQQYQQQNRPHYQSNQYAPVSPVGRAGGSMADQYMSQNPSAARNGVTLSPADQHFINNLQIMHPSGKRALTRDEVRTRYIQSMKMSKSGKPNQVVIPG